MKIFPVIHENASVGYIKLEDKIVAKLEQLMKKKFETLDCQPFVIAAVFRAEVKDISTKLVNIEILENT